MARIKQLMISIMILSIIVLSGCSDNITPPPLGPTDRSMVDYSFIDISNSCSIYNNINLSNMTSPCILPQEETFMFYSDEYNWTIMCCEYESKCIADSVNLTNYNNICENNQGGSYNGYVYNDDGFWLAQCCDLNGGACYVDLEIDVTNQSTVCDEDYHQNTYGMNFNNTDWKAMCCIGGLEE